MAERLELGDMQRLILDGDRGRPEARYALLEIQHLAAARAWLASVRPRVANAERRDDPAGPGDYRLALAFTHAGVAKLGLRVERGFSLPFRTGMHDLARAVALGDDPTTWCWGNGATPIHVLLIVFSSQGRRDADWHTLLPGLQWAKEAVTLDGDARDTEPFGFRDGISQPYLEGSGTSRIGSPGDTVKPGEFVLGYLNEAGVPPTSPVVDAARDPAGLLPALHAHPELHDFGRNGTYLVLRQLRQDVKGFDDYLKRQAPGDKARQDWIAAKLVGRWRSGAPLVKAPHADREALGDDNDFGYHDADRYGHACPVGAHIRRANPRDALADEARGTSPDLAARMSRRHRLIRRGRVWQSGDETGLLFLCLNASLQDQFEFVQHTWLHSPRFAGLDGETDPLLGPRTGGSDHLTLQSAGGSERLAALPRFVDVLGGAYFFLPGLRALDYLAQLAD